MVLMRMPRVMWAVMLLAACGGRPDSESAEVSKTAFEASGKQWPVSVDAGRVGCKPMEHDADERWFEAGGVRYGLNGFATGEKGYADITPIWLENVELTRQVEAMYPGQKLKTVNRISLGDLSEAAAGMCEGRS